MRNKILCKLFQFSLLTLNGVLSKESFSLFGVGPLSQAPSSMLQNHDLYFKPSSDIMITMASSVDPVIQSIADSPFESREARATALTQSLQSHSLASQAPALEQLQLYGIQAESHWLTNQIHVKNASPPIIQALLALGLTIIRIIGETLEIPFLPVFDQVEGKPPNGTEWNVKKIRAHEVWEETRGEGIIVAGIDSGVRGTHEALAGNYVGNRNYGWYDPMLQTQRPVDYQGHGTHTMGTIAGTNGIGVAPGAKWMACRACMATSCNQNALIACGQFVLCPTDTNGKNQNCSKIPHIVNNSWGGPGGTTWYSTIIKAWKTAGIIPFFAIGNSGPKCATAGAPGDLENLISVGSTDITDKLSTFSSRGPAIEERQEGGFLIFGAPKPKIGTRIKPEVCAPGENINSANHLHDSSYKSQSGTSMASPATAGAAALLLSKNPRLSLEKIMNLLSTTTEQGLKATGTEQCGSTKENQFPNNMYGHGRINVLAAYKKMIKEMAE